MTATTAALFVVALLVAPPAKADKAKAARDAALRHFERIVQRLDGQWTEEQKQFIAKAYVEAQQEQIPGALQKAKGLLEAMQNQLGNAVGDDRKRLRQAIKDQQKYVKQLSGKDAAEYVLPELEKLSAGAIGRVPYKLRVLQVLGDKEMICELGNDTIWVDGIPTAGLADGSSFRTDDDYVLFVAGTKSYTNTLGASKTVFVVQPVIRFNK